MVRTLRVVACQCTRGKLIFVITSYSIHYTKLYDAGQQEYVAWMRVRMKEAELEALFEDGVGADGNDLPSFVLGQFFWCDC